MLSNVEVRKIAPSDYKLFQVADLICTLELTKMKYTDGTASKSEHEFFHGMNQFKKDFNFGSVLLYRKYVTRNN